MPITLSSEATDRLGELARLRGMDPEELFLALLDAEEDSLLGTNWWLTLSEEEREVERAALRESFAASDAGRVRPADEVYGRIRAKYNTGTSESR